MSGGVQLIPSVVHESSGLERAVRDHSLARRLTPDRLPITPGTTSRVITQSVPRLPDGTWGASAGYDQTPILLASDAAIAAKIPSSASRTAAAVGKTPPQVAARPIAPAGRDLDLVAVERAPDSRELRHDKRSRQLVAEYISAEFGEVARPSWIAAATLPLTGQLLLTSLLSEAALAFADGITTANPDATGIFIWSGIRYL